MPNVDFIPRTDEGKAALFERVRDTIGGYTAILGLDAAEVADQAEDATWFRYVLNHSLVVRNAGSQWTSFKNELLGGPGDGSTPATPVTPALPAPIPTAMPLGILPRFREFVRRIKVAPAYTDSIGKALDIVGPESFEPDLGTIAPKISLRLISGKVEVVWNKNGMPGVEIQKDTGTGWELLAIDTRPNYTDATPLPATPAKWKYRAIYCEGSERLGNWSNVAEITVAE